MDANKWIKEIIGLPSYLAAGVIGVVISDGNFIILFFVMVIAAVIYNSIYSEFFVDFVITGKKKQLLVFLVLEVLILILILGLVTTYKYHFPIL
jgi:ABC-type bacteriocin/lantibiotic exporter with double-glycine peptidase domain